MKRKKCGLQEKYIYICTVPKFKLKLALSTEFIFSDIFLCLALYTKNIKSIVLLSLLFEKKLNHVKCIYEEHTNIFSGLLPTTFSVCTWTKFFQIYIIFILYERVEGCVILQIQIIIILFVVFNIF